MNERTSLIHGFRGGHVDAASARRGTTSRLKTAVGLHHTYSVYLQPERSRCANMHARKHSNNLQQL